jgi:hypothetical protein
MMADFEWATILRDAALLKPSMRVSYSEDVRWLFNFHFGAWLLARGEPVSARKRKRLTYRKSDAVYFQGEPLRYATGLAEHPEEVIDPEFCLTYGFEDFGFGDYSHQALNYRHQFRKASIPATYVSSGPKTLGNFAVILDRPPTGYVCPMPGELRSCGTAEIPYGKTRSLQAWLGVWYDRRAIRPSLLTEIEFFPEIKTLWPKWPRYDYGLSKFMEYYGDRGNNEVEMREQMGFKPKGKTGLSEEILFRSVCAIFGVMDVKRRYRGRELGGLEIDVWVPSRKLGFEYQGEQHWSRLAHWQGDDGFAHQQQRDVRKKEICEALGYRLLYLEPGSDLRREAIVIELRALKWLGPEFQNDPTSWPELLRASVWGGL